MTASDYLVVERLEAKVEELRAEIERLRAEMDQRMAAYIEYQERDEAEIKRLRAIEQAALAAYRYHMTGYGKEPEDFNANKMLDLMNELGAAL